MAYILEPLARADIREWDRLIAPFQNAFIFHRAAWLQYLAESRGIEIRYWRIQNRTNLVGYFCGGVVRKGPFRVLGSPLKGWGSNFMGPAVNADVDPHAFLSALDEVAKREKFAMVEIENPVLPASEMDDCGFHAVSQPTYVVELTPDNPQLMWSRIDLKARQKIRKARKLGVHIEEMTDVAMTDEFYSQFVEVLARKNLYPPYNRKCPRLLFQHLKDRGMLFALVVRDRDERCIGTGLFPYDERAVYFWGGASRLSGWAYSPNDFLQWSLMELAASKGIRSYNMCGYGPFKSKFGGKLEQPIRWRKSYWHTAEIARRVYGFVFQNQIKLRGCVQRILSSGGDAEEPARVQDDAIPAQGRGK